ncbi:TetR/AcrR family transcriptional regulator [Arthrobacter sp. FX8]|uniref:TetR/AcrR family transcriptional regulator n=1 Tax=Arthrobacter sp. FX8 TaxID=2997335 RepID=UPI00227BF5C8|nr:TetR/AcrR family transcriptional regulator [Arthrobacter sp. FX8]WAJ33019.1 TetR/AcrR family transcriptional regulator [Arthrobacter sp. FX8]
MEHSSAHAVKSPGRPRGFDRAAALDAALDLFWQRGYESTSISDLCDAMSIRPPSLYAAFGNKAQLFLEAVDRYERTYWDPVWRELKQEPDVRRAFSQLFDTGATIMSAQDGRQGCLVTLSAVGMSPASADVAKALDKVRADGVGHIHGRLKDAVKDGQLSDETNLLALADALNAILDGMALRSRDGVSVERLRRMGQAGERMLPTEIG